MTAPSATTSTVAAPTGGAPAATYDAIVVGGGHNGLTCAAYLARAGRHVLVLEARDTVGGCASSVDGFDGARFNVCNCDHALVRATGVIEELELADHGLRYLDMEPGQLALPWDGSTPWLLFHDVERTLHSLSLTHPTQVAGYRRYVDELLPAARLVLAMTTGVPTLRGVAGRLARHRGRGARALLRLSRRSAADVLRRYFDDEALLGSPATTGPAVWGLSAETPGTGLGALGYALRHAVPVGRPIGGSGALTDAIAAAVTAAGGEIRTGVRVAAIRSAGGPARGVTLEDGTRIDATTVIGAGDPRTTLVDLLDAPPAAAGDLVARWRDRAGGEGYESKIDAVVDVLPRPRGLTDAYLAAVGVDDPLIATMVVTPTLASIADAATTARAGGIAARPPMLVNVPSVLDPTVGPRDDAHAGAGRPPDATATSGPSAGGGGASGPGDVGTATRGAGHVFSLEVLFTPYALRGGWAGSGEPERWLAAFAELMEPGFLEGVRAWRNVGPEDYERDFSMPRGYASSFAGGPLTALLGRDRELTRYATPVPGLFLTGAGTFPGAGVSGAPGRNAAGVVLAATGG
ncbi:NAD(P)/FAD-dependent oxidoreductase [Patulibacter sp. NPDC049589]|uniref:phytoene desaturase family protein n=1 Tax=Patulibacter sp. NPDC049589 TaxID=3154731 RepID=UPI0034211E73